MTKPAPVVGDGGHGPIVRRACGTPRTRMGLQALEPGLLLSAAVPAQADAAPAASEAITAAVSISLSAVKPQISGAYQGSQAGKITHPRGIDINKHDGSPGTPPCCTQLR